MVGIGRNSGENSCDKILFAGHAFKCTRVRLQGVTIPASWIVLKLGRGAISGARRVDPPVINPVQYDAEQSHRVILWNMHIAFQ